MKKNFLFASLLACGLAFSMSSCSDDDEKIADVNPADVDLTTENASAWYNYMKNVAALLNEDSKVLYDAWSVSYNTTGKSYGELFKEHDNASGYTGVKSCAQEVVEKCAEIANEVGGAKIGDPYDKWASGDKNSALYAVESWYSWHSRDDYTNNIYSIRNAYYGSLDGTIAEYSFAKALEGSDIDVKVRAAIKNAAKAIQDIAQPFRNHIGSEESKNAMDACATLQALLSEVEAEDGGEISAADVNLREAVLGLDETTLQNIINNYIDHVVIPTYRDLKEKNELLLASINSLLDTPTNSAFKSACNAWLVAREPWEKSEAFLFGPVDEFGLDPNMDSWPLDQNAIMQIMNSKNWNDLEWSDGDDDSKVESAQNVRGFHTLEFLLFKNGEARTVPAGK